MNVIAIIMKQLLLVSLSALLLTSPGTLGRTAAQFVPAGVDGSEFVFARLIYPSYYGRRGRGSWATDWPKADKQFMFGIDRLSNVRIVLDQDVAIEIMDDNLFSYPFLYAVEVGKMEINQMQADRLREYMLRGGFFVVDDFWGTYEWENFSIQLKKIFPEKEVEEVPLSHPIFHSFYDIDQILQIPNVNLGCDGYRTHEQDGYTPFALAVYDDNRRPMMMINYNTDLGDAWEWADAPCYPHEFSGMAYRMGLNFIIYSMTH